MIHTHIQACTLMHACARTHTNTHKHKHMHTKNTQADTHTLYTQTHTNAHMQTHTQNMQINIHTYKYTIFNICRVSDAKAHSKHNYVDHDILLHKSTHTILSLL